MDELVTRLGRRGGGVSSERAELCADGIGGPSVAEDRPHFTGPYSFRELAGIGHDLPQEAPREFAAAVLSLI